MPETTSRYIQTNKLDTKRAYTPNVITGCDFTQLRNALIASCSALIAKHNNKEDYQTQTAQNIMALLGNETNAFESWCAAFKIFSPNQVSKLETLAQLLFTEIHQNNVFSSIELFRMMQIGENMRLTIFQTMNLAFIEAHLAYFTEAASFLSTDDHRLFIPDEYLNDYTTVFKKILPTNSALLPPTVSHAKPVKQMDQPSNHDPKENDSEQKSIACQTETVPTLINPTMIAAPSKSFEQKTHLDDIVITNILSEAAKDYLDDFGNIQKTTFFGGTREKKGVLRNTRIVSILNNLPSDAAKPIKLKILMLALLNNGTETPNRVAFFALNKQIIPLNMIQEAFKKNNIQVCTPKAYCKKVIVAAINILKLLLHTEINSFYQYDPTTRQVSQDHISKIADTLELTEEKFLEKYHGQLPWPVMPYAIEDQVSTQHLVSNGRQ